LNPIEARLISIELIELYQEGAVFHEFGLPGRERRKRRAIPLAFVCGFT